MSIAGGKSHSTCIYYGHVLSSVQIAKYLRSLLQMSCLSWSILSCTLDPRPCKLHPGALGFLGRNLRRCPAKLIDCVYYVSSLYTGMHKRPFGILIWPRTVICWRSYSGDHLRGLLNGITGQHPVCPRCCMILAGVTLKTAGRTLDWLCSTRLSLHAMHGHVAINPDQIGLVAADNRTRANHRYKFRAIGASSTGLRYSFAARTVSDCYQLPAVVVEQENPAAFKVGQMCACSHAITHHHH